MDRSGIAHRVLIVEDDRTLVDLLRRGLEDDGHGVCVALNYASGFKQAMTGDFHALVVDISLPDGSGVDLVASLRRHGLDVPMLMLTARGDAETMVSGLDSGADDYVVKPVSLDVLGARLRALHRRWRPPTSAPIRVGDLTLEPSRLVAKRRDHEIDLTPSQARVLEVLMRNAGNVLSRSQIANHLRDGDEEPGSNVIDVHIRALRSKIDYPFGTSVIETVRGAGYRVRRLTRAS